jgi:hypothetical protein
VLVGQGFERRLHWLPPHIVICKAFSESWFKVHFGKSVVQSCDQDAAVLGPCTRGLEPLIIDPLWTVNSLAHSRKVSL